MTEVDAPFVNDFFAVDDPHPLVLRNGRVNVSGLETDEIADSWQRHAIGRRKRCVFV